MNAKIVFVLVTPGGLSASGGVVGESMLIEELARVLWDPEKATLFALLAGFPPSHMPLFRSPLAFWTQVVAEAVSGIIEGGVAPLVSIAAKQYPGNVIFRHWGRSDRAIRPTSPCAKEIEAWRDENR